MDEDDFDIDLEVESNIVASPATIWTLTQVVKWAVSTLANVILTQGVGVVFVKISNESLINFIAQTGVVYIVVWIGGMKFIKKIRNTDSRGVIIDD
ncbi:hypothetical protein IT417_03235 [bacterium]|nr:hypothetical protein [bacterium]